MIRVNRLPAPEDLDGDDSTGGRERARAIAFFADPANKERAFKTFAAYRRAAVKAALAEAFGGKCAYCESSYAETAPVDVEHYRPKGGYSSAGELRTPGYYWLASNWLNLLPSCIDCNRARTQTFADAPPHLSGKANQFPIRDERRRAQAPDAERDEGRLLLHPYLDFPERHLHFDDEGHVEPARDIRGRASPKGRTSIEVYGLERDGLVRGRRRVAIRLAVIRKNIERTSELLEDYPDDQRFVEALAEHRRELARLTEADQEYAQMARQMVSRMLRELTGVSQPGR
jgi:uncharacterized protein (TIGR02646 family)